MEERLTIPKMEGFSTKTDIPIIDSALAKPEYYAEEKGIVVTIEIMSPDEYLARSDELQGVTREESARMIDSDLVDKYSEMMKAGTNFDVPYLDYKIGGQEGRHRVLAAKKAGINEIPVANINKANPSTVANPVGATTPTGTCYEDAWRFFIKQEEGALVHGSVQLSATGPRVEHAWVELPTGYVWEPQTGQYFSTGDFRIFSPKEEARYTVKEAALMLVKVGQHGPWTGEERLMLGGKGNPTTRGRALTGQETTGLLRKATTPDARGLLPTGGSEIISDILLGDNSGVSDNLGNIDVTDRMIENAQKQIKSVTDASLEHRGLPDEFVVWRGGEIKGDIVPVTLDRSVAEQFAGFKAGKGQIQSWTVKKSDILADIEAFTGQYFSEGELLIHKDNLFTKPANEFLPMSPSEGPPLPKGLGLKWPWRK